MNSFKQTNTGPDEEGLVFTYCGNSYGMETLSNSVRALVAGEMAQHPQREFLSNAYEALRGSREILASRHLPDQALYSVASRQQMSSPTAQSEERLYDDAL